jgi:hypothetical protein
VIDSCVFRNFATAGVYATGSACDVTTTDCSIYQEGSYYQSGDGIHLNNNMTVTISGCEIYDCDRGVYTYADPTIYAVGCELQGNQTADFQFTSYYSEYVHGHLRYCNIHNTGSASSWGIYCSRSGTGAGSGVIDANYNWWRYNDSLIIENDFVYDHEDDGNLPRVDFMPFVDDENLRPCVSDFDFSGRTDYDDLAMLGFAFGSEPGDFNWMPICNISEVGVSELRIDGLDLAYFGSQFGIEGGCYPFGKIVVPQIVADSFTLAASRSFHNDTLSVHLEPTGPSGSDFLGIAFDLVVDSSLVLNDPFVQAGERLRNSGLAAHSCIRGDRWIYAVVSMNHEPIDRAILTDLLSFTIDCLSDCPDSVMSLEHVAFVLDGYRIVLAPRVLYEEGSDELLPKRFAVYQNYPNPFNPSTTISYALDVSSSVKVIIYNALGQRVRSFEYPHQFPGIYEVIWDGRDSYGSEVATGVYFYRVESATNSDTKKMLLLK